MSGLFGGARDREGDIVFGRRAYALAARKLTRTPWGRRFLSLVRRHATGFEWASVALEALLMYLVISSFVVRAYAIPSGSMRPTLKEGDRIFVNKFIYWLKPPEYGDIVVFRVPRILLERDPQKPEYVKRVVGRPNDYLEIRRVPGHAWGRLYINGRPTPPDNPVSTIHYYPRTVAGGPLFSGVRVPDGEIYVFGDNSSNSSDSREWGGVPLENLRGKAFFRFWPPHRIGSLE